MAAEKLTPHEYGGIRKLRFILTTMDVAGCDQTVMDRREIQAVLDDIRTLQSRPCHNCGTLQAGILLS